MDQVVSGDAVTQRAQAGEARFHTLAEHVPQLVWTARPDGSWDYVNGRWESLTGTPRDAALGLGWRDAVHPDDLARWTAQTSDPGAGAVVFQARLRARGGGHQRVWVQLERVRVDASEIWVGTGTPLDGSPGVEPEGHGARFTRSVLDSIFAFVAVLELDGTVVDVNEPPLLATGLRREDVIGKKFWEAPWGDHPADERRRVQDAIHRAARGEVVRFEDDTIFPDGTVGTADFQIAPLRDEHGRVTHVVPSAVDITERKRAEAALRESEQRYRTLFESIDEGFCALQILFDERGEPVDFRVLQTNTAFERHTGLTGASGRTTRAAQSRPDPALVRILGEVSRGDRTPARFEWYEASLDRWFDVYAGPTGDPALHQVAVVFTNVTERRRAEAVLRESEERARRAADEAERERRLLDAVLEAAPIGIIVADARGQILRANPANERLWGRAPSSASTEPHAQWKGWWADGSSRHGLPIDRCEWALARALRGETVPGDLVEIEPEDPPGARRTMIVSGAPVRDASGQVAGAVVAEMDVTARVAAEAAVRRSEERYRLVARAANEVIWDWDIQSGHVEWSDTMLRHFGCTPEELGDGIEGWASRVHPDDRARVFEMMRSVVDDTTESSVGEYRLRRNDGTYAVVLDRGYVARDASGKPVRMIGSILDISEQRRIEAALRESEERFRALADGMSQLAWIADAHGDLLWSNQRWLEYTGTTPEQARGRGWERALHPEHVERVVQELREHLRSGEAWEDTVPMRSADGTYRWFLSRAVPIREAGEVVRCFVTHTDVTSQREAEQALRDADRRKDEFLAMLAHELRNPLAPVRTAVQLLGMMGPREPGLERLRQVIDRQVTHMARLIDDLLDVSRIARGRIQLQKERHDLTQIVRQTTEDYRASLEAAGLTLTLDVRGAPVWVHGDRTRLAQIVGNLLHNAGKFTERGGKVAVRVGVDEETRSALVSVADTGIGIEPAMLARLFDPFAQAAQGLDRSKGGLGLGLALAKALVELHGGEVTASSAGSGKGSTFVMRLPLAPQATDAVPVGHAQGAGTGLRIVIIEDNEDAATTLEMLLTLAGHQVAVASDGRAGIDAVRALRPEVVICDIGLPGGVDGYAVGRALRAEPGLAPALMIALSGYSQDDDRRRSREAGFDVHLAKPADLDTLQSLLGRVTRHP